MVLGLTARPTSSTSKQKDKLSSDLVGRHRGAVVSPDAPQQKGRKFNPNLAPFCVEFACLRGFSPGTAASSHSRKTCTL